MERMARSVVSASSRCAISHCEPSSDASLPFASRSHLALAMPYSYKAFKSAISSRMIDLRNAQAVIALRIGHRRFFYNQRCFHGLGMRCGMEYPRKNILDVFGIERARFEHQFDGDQHGFDTMLGYAGEHFCHDPVTAVALEQSMPQALQRLRHISEGCAIPQCARLALNQRNVVLPVIYDLAAVGLAQVADNDRFALCNIDAFRVKAGANTLSREFTRYGITVVRHGYQAGAGNFVLTFQIPVKGGWHRHQKRLLVFQHLRHTQLGVFRMPYFTPQDPAAFQQPQVQL